MSKALDPESAQERAHTLVALERALQRLAEPDSNPSFDGLGRETFSYGRYWQILVSRKRVVLAFVVLSLLVALVATYNTTPIYRSTLLLQIEPQTDRFLEFQGNVSMGDLNWDRHYYQTQYDLLESHSLARRVIDQLGLEAVEHGTQVKTKSSFLGQLKDTVKGWIGDNSKHTDETGLSGKQGIAKPNLEAVVMGNLTIAPLPESRLVEIHYESTSPKEAAAVANAVAENFINMTLERRYDATAYAKKFLDERIEQVRANLEDSEKRFIAYARERKIVDINNKLGNLLQTLNATNQALIRVEAQRIEARAQHRQSNAQKGAAAHKMLESDMIQGLKGHKTELELEYKQQLKVFKPGYPKMQRLAQQIAEIDKQIHKESTAIADAIKADYEAKREQEAALRSRVSEIKAEILDLENKSTDYQALKRELETNRELYDGLLQRIKEVGVVSGISTNNISIVDRALVPEAAYKPSLRQNLAIALALGLTVGILVAFLFERLDDSVKAGEDIERRAHIPVLGVIPMVMPKSHSIEKEQVPLLAAKAPKSPLAEATRSLRTSLIFSTPEGAPKVMHVTSPGPGEGKSTAASNVAITFAMTGSTVLLIDADLRVPSLHRTYSLPNSLGLTNYLAGDIKPADITQATELERLFTITSGPLPPNPVELLSSARMLDLLALASERFDYVIVDGPPVVGLADALVLGSACGRTFLVVDSARTRYGALEGAMKRLRAANGTILGAVVNRLASKNRGYGYAYNYDYHYSYGDPDQEPALPGA